MKIFFEVYLIKKHQIKRQNNEIHGIKKKILLKTIKIVIVQEFTMEMKCG